MFTADLRSSLCDRAFKVQKQHGEVFKKTIDHLLLLVAEHSPREQLRQRHHRDRQLTTCAHMLGDDGRGKRMKSVVRLQKGDDDRRVEQDYAHRSLPFVAQLIEPARGVGTGW